MPFRGEEERTLVLLSPFPALVLGLLLLRPGHGMSSSRSPPWWCPLWSTPASQGIGRLWHKRSTLPAHILNHQGTHRCASRGGRLYDAVPSTSVGTRTPQALCRLPPRARLTGAAAES